MEEQSKYGKHDSLSEAEKMEMARKAASAFHDKLKEDGKEVTEEKVAEALRAVEGIIPPNLMEDACGPGVSGKIACIMKILTEYEKMHSLPDKEKYLLQDVGDIRRTVGVSKDTKELQDLLDMPPSDLHEIVGRGLASAAQAYGKSHDCFDDTLLMAIFVGFKKGAMWNIISEEMQQFMMSAAKQYILLMNVLCKHGNLSINLKRNDKDELSLAFSVTEREKNPFVSLEH